MALPRSGAWHAAARAADVLARIAPLPGMRVRRAPHVTDLRLISLPAAPRNSSLTPLFSVARALSPFRLRSASTGSIYVFERSASGAAPSLVTVLPPDLIGFSGEPVARVCFSADSRFLAVAAASGVVTVIETGLATASSSARKPRRLLTIDNHRGASVVALHWRNEHARSAYFFSGDNAGVVCVTDVGTEAAATLSAYRERTVQLHHTHEPVVQIDYHRPPSAPPRAEGDGVEGAVDAFALLVSTTRRALIVRARVAAGAEFAVAADVAQIGSKLRNAPLGACFITTASGDALSGDGGGEGDSEGGERLSARTTTTAVLAARPGKSTKRLWVADLNSGTVRSTLKVPQFSFVFVFVFVFVCFVCFVLVTHLSFSLSYFLISSAAVVERGAATLRR